MKTIPALAQTQIDRQYGAKPTIVVDVYWTGTPTSYSTDSSFGQKRLMSVANITQSGSMRQITDVSDTTVKLSDHDGELKFILDNTPMLYKRCVIKQVFKDASTSFIELMDGKVNSPITWDEEARTLTFSVIAKANSKPVTILPDQYERCQLPYPPMCFGTVMGVKGVTTDCELDSILLEAVGENVTGKMTEGTFNARTTVPFDHKFKVSNPQNYPSGEITIQIEGTLFKGEVQGNEFVVTEHDSYWNKTYGQTYIISRAGAGDDPDYNNPSVFWSYDNTGLLRNRYVKIKYDVSDVYGYKEDGDERFQEADEFTPDASPLNATHYSFNRVTSQDGNKCTLEHPVTDRFGRPLLLGDDPRLSNEAVMEICGQYELGGRWAGNLQYNQLPYWRVPPGAQIYLYSIDAGVTYCFNSLPSTALYGLFGMKQGMLTPIGTNKYTPNLNDTTTYSGKTVTTAKFDYYLTQYNEGWDSNEIYAALKSSEGPNVVDVIEYIVTNYLKKPDDSFYTVDNTSFTAVKNQTSVINYPVGFALFNERDALGLLDQICWEAHLGLTLRNGVAYLMNLAEDFRTPSKKVFDLDKSKSEFNSCDINLTDISDVYTRFIAYWKENYYPFTQDNRLIKSNNTDIFETLDYEHNYLIYNIYECVLRSVEFWLERYSNIWYEMEISTFLYGIGLDPYDIVGIDISEFVSDDYGQVLEYDLDNKDMSTVLKLWLPSSPSGGVAFPDIFVDNPDEILSDQIEFIEELKDWTPTPYMPMIMPGLARREMSVDPAIRLGERNYYDQSESSMKKFRVKEFNPETRIAVCEAVSMGDRTKADPIIANSNNPNSTGTDVEIYIPRGKTAPIGGVLYATCGARQAIVEEE